MRIVSRVVLAVISVVFLTATLASAQETSTSTETKTFEVIAVDGNNLVVKLPEGTRELTVPDDFRFTVNGTPMSVRELKPGMTGTATITTTTRVTPVTVTEVKDGEVFQASGSSIIVQTPQGFRSFTQGEVDKRQVKIYRGCKPAQVSDFHVGDRLSATIITSGPPKVVTEKEVQAAVAASGAPAPSRPTASTPAAAPLSATSTGVGTAGSTAPAAPAARKLPKTAGPLPLIGLVGLTSLTIGVALTNRRRRRER